MIEKTVNEKECKIKYNVNTKRAENKETGNSKIINLAVSLVMLNGHNLNILIKRHIVLDCVIKTQLYASYKKHFK